MALKFRLVLDNFAIHAPPVTVSRCAPAHWATGGNPAETSPPRRCSVSHSTTTQTPPKTVKRSPLSHVYSLSQDIITKQLTARHTGAALIASHRGEWPTAYGAKGGERWDGGKLLWTAVRVSHGLPSGTEPSFSPWRAAAVASLAPNMLV